MTPRFALGLDYGTASIRALIADVTTGEEIAAATWSYQRGDQGVILDPADANLARQHPADYMEGFEHAIVGALAVARARGDFSPERVVGIGIDTTGSTPLPVDAAGMPLALRPPFDSHPGAMAWLWKDHTSHAEAEEITRRATSAGLPYLSRCGGVYSSEWFWAKLLRCARAHPEVLAAMHAWVECSDWIPAWLTGSGPLIVRNVCAAGHKAMFHQSWGGPPDAAFLDALHPGLSRLRATVELPARAAGQRAGGLAPGIAARVGLPPGIPISIGALDAHIGAVGSGVGPGTLVKIIGTSTCDCMVTPMDPDPGCIPGVCGIVPGSIIPGMLGIEAGQSAVGDIFSWYAGHTGTTIEDLAEEASLIRPGRTGLLALDWHNGNRSILTDPRLTGLILGQTLATTRADVFRCLIEATAFGALRIIDQIAASAISIDRIVACGGIADRSPLVMQIYADVCGRPIEVAASPQACALGSAIFGSIVGGAHPDVATAQRAMVRPPSRIYRPDPAAAGIYRDLYSLYRSLHDAFGLKSGVLHPVMKHLLNIRDRA